MTKSSLTGTLLVVALCWLALVAFCAPAWLVMDHFESLKRALLSLIPPLVLLMNSEHPERRPRFSISLAALFLLACFTAPSGIATLHDAEIWLAWVLPPMMFYCAWSLPPESTVLIRTGILFAGIAQAILMLLQFFGYNPFGVETTTPAAAMIGTIGYHNQAASFLFLCAGLAWIDALKKQLFARRALYVASGLLMAATAMLTGCRGAFLAFSAALFCCALPYTVRLYRSHRRWFLLLLAALLLFLLIAGLPVFLRFFSMNPLEPAYGLRSRLIMWQAARQLFLEHPFTGSGAGGFAAEYLRLLASVLPDIKTHALLQSVVYAREPHNDALFLLSEFGLVGAAALLLACIACLKRMRQLHADGHITRLLTAVFLLIFILGDGMLSFAWHYPVSGPLAALLLGLSLSPTAPHPGESPRLAASASLLHLVVLIFALFISATAILQAYHHRYLFNEDMFLFQSHLTPRMKALLGAAIYRDMDQPKGLQLMQEAWTQSPDPLLANNLGAALTEQGRLNEAEQVYRLWTDSGLVHSQALHNLSITLENLGKHREADRYYERLHILWPETTTWSIARRIDLAMRSGEPEKVIELATPWLTAHDEVRPPAGLSEADWLHILNFAAAAHLMQNRPIPTAELLQRVLTIQPDNTMALRNLEALRSIPTEAGVAQPN